MKFKPILGASLDGVPLENLTYPLIALPKLDGLRCIIYEGVAYSRNAKPIRNEFVQAWAHDKHNLDGEIIVGSPTEGLVLERSKAVTAFKGEPDFRYHLFDCYDHDGGYLERATQVQAEMEEEDRIECVPMTTVYTADQVRNVEAMYLAMGYEGLILRNPKGVYKNGRSTLNEGYLMKLKRFVDGEAIVLRLEEAQQNNNELTRDELGRAKRASNQENKSGKGMIGTIIGLDKTWGEIRISPGIMPHSERMALWHSPHSILGRTIHWRSFGYGVMNAPRFARYYGIREE